MSSSNSSKGGEPPRTRSAQKGRLRLVPTDRSPTGEVTPRGTGSDPPPLGPLPPVGDDYEPDDLFSTPTDMDGPPTRPIRRMDLADLINVEDDLPAPEPEPEYEVEDSPGPAWNEPPELPEPPVQFAPPEMTMPPSPPDAVVEDPTTRLEPGPSGDASHFAEEIGTPELPDVTPSGDPLEVKIRRARPTEDLVSGGSGHYQRRGNTGGEFESAVISRVVDMSPAVMQMRPAAGVEEDRTGTTPGTWTDTSDMGTNPKGGSTEAENITSVWMDDAIDSHPEQAKLLENLDQERPPTMPSNPIVPDQRDVVARRYRVLERIGVGGMARIFKVQHVELGKYFALKIIHSALSGDSKIKEMFYREARLASSLDHPNIVLLTDFGVDSNYGAFIVMEYLKGETLHARLRREGRLHANVACEIALQVAEALHFIHGKNVVHCDIKSENVFLCEPPPDQRRRTIVKLLDFGLSRQKIASGRVSLSEVGGTPAYMAPERINRASPRPSMDIYSLGVLYYEMLTGTLPFLGTMEEVLIAQLKKKPTRLSKRLKDPVDDRLEELVMKALEKKPEKRQKDVGAFIYELRTVMDMLGIGRRRGKQPAERVRSGAAVARVKNCELLVADCPLPLFMTDPSFNLILANKAFASFVNIEVEKIAGTRLMDTRLGRVCPEIFEDLKKAISTRKQTQRILSFPWRTAKQVSMMIWLTPEFIDKQLVGMVGVIHPFTTSST